MLPCAYKQLFGIDCPICGSQRALLLLLKGDFVGSWVMYPPLAFVVSLAFLGLLRLADKRIVSRRLLERTSIITLVVVSLNYAYKLIFIS